MRIWIKRMCAAVLVLSLMMGIGTGASATETEPPRTETEPGATETVPESTEGASEITLPDAYEVDTESELYRVLDELAQDMKSDQILVYDATDDTILYTSTNEGDKLYPASITKLYSAYVALQYLDPEEVLTAGDELDLVQPHSSLAYIRKEHMLFVRTVVEAMMLPSGNDAAMILAAAAGRRIAGDENLSPTEAVQTFVAEMNRMAKELGFERSHFSNPDGFHVGSHYTCLSDMARIAKLALGNKTISRYIRLSSAEVTFVSGQTIKWENTNLFLNTERGFYRGDAIGMKTGYTSQAEYCLMSAFRCSDGRIIVIGNFGCEDEYDRLREASELINACKEELNRQRMEEAKATETEATEAENGTP